MSIIIFIVHTENLQEMNRCLLNFYENRYSNNWLLQLLQMRSTSHVTGNMSVKRK